MSLSKLTVMKQAQRGITLIEVLVAMILIGIGLIGLASLQTTSMQTAHDAHFRSQASILVKDLAERMKSNDSVLKGNDYVFSALTDLATAGPDCEAAACTPADVALYDREQWRMLVENSPLPDADASVQKVAGELATYQLRIFWNSERQDGVAANPNCLPTAGLMSCFQFTTVFCSNLDPAEVTTCN